MKNILEQIDELIEATSKNDGVPFKRYGSWFRVHKDRLQYIPMMKDGSKDSDNDWIDVTHAPFKTKKKNEHWVKIMNKEFRTKFTVKDFE